MTDRRIIECPFCGGDLLEPRSSEYWNCAICARQYTDAEVDA